MNETPAKTIINTLDVFFVKILRWPGEKSIALLLYLGDKKRLFPDAFKKVLIYVLVPLIGGLATYFGWGNIPQPIYWPDILETHHITYTASRSFLISLVCGFFAFLVCRVILPMLFYVPHAMSMRSMGLLESSVRKDGMLSSIQKNLQWHDNKQSIKVICISGHNLFGLKGPLFEIAKVGKLEVLFPFSDNSNPTIKARYETYNPDFRIDTYPSVDDLVEEIKKSKNALMQNSRNKKYEHKELCMWRVVILSSHCIVQSYFPNRDGCHSDSAPVFVYSKEIDCPHSYYDTFVQMFELLKLQQG